MDAEELLSIAIKSNVKVTASNSGKHYIVDTDGTLKEVKVRDIVKDFKNRGGSPC